MAPSLEDRIQQLLGFEAEHGHMFVSSTFKKDGLGRWVSNMRANRNLGKVKSEVINDLDKVGFAWVVPKGPKKNEMVEWGKQFRWLVNFHKSKGHSNVPSKIGGKIVPAAEWCDEQRQLHMHGKLEQEKVNKLSQLGFDFYGSSKDEDEPVSSKELYVVC